MNPRLLLLPLLLLAYLGVHVAVDAPNIADPWLARNGMANWVAPIEAPAGNPSALPIYKRGPLRSKSPGYQAIYRLTRATGDPVRLAKAYPWAVVAGAIFMIFGLGARLAGPVAGFLAALFFLHRPGLLLMLAGLPEIFVWIFVPGFLWALEANRPRWAVAAVAGVGLFYAPVALVLGGVLLAWRALPTLQQRGPRAVLRDRVLWGLFAVLVGLALLIAPMTFLGGDGEQPVKLGYVQSLAREQALLGDGLLPPGRLEYRSYTLPEEAPLEHWAREIVGPMVRPFAVWGPLPGPLEARAAWRSHAAAAALLFGLVGLAVLLGRRAAMPRSLALLLAASVALYLLAASVAFTLYYPNRYVNFTLPLVGMMYAALLLARGFEAVPERWRAPAAAGFGGAWLLLFGTGVSADNPMLDDYRDASGLLEFLATTPPGTTVAGPPYLMDAVELYAERHTLVLCQELISVSHILSGPDYEELRGRIHDLHRGWFSPDPQALLALADRYGTDLIVVHRPRLQPRFFAEYDPVCAFVAEDIPGTDLTRAFLARVPAPLLTWDDGTYAVLPTERLREWVAAMSATAPATPAQVPPGPASPAPGSAPAGPP